MCGSGRRASCVVPDDVAPIPDLFVWDSASASRRAVSSWGGHSVSREVARLAWAGGASFPPLADNAPPAAAGGGPSSGPSWAPAADSLDGREEVVVSAAYRAACVTKPAIAVRAAAIVCVVSPFALGHGRYAGPDSVAVSGRWLPNAVQGWVLVC